MLRTMQNQHKNGKKYGSYTILMLVLLCCLPIRMEARKMEKGKNA